MSSLRQKTFQNMFSHFLFQRTKFWEGNEFFWVYFKIRIFALQLHFKTEARTAHLPFFEQTEVSLNNGNSRSWTIAWHLSSMIEHMQHENLSKRVSGCLCCGLTAKSDRNILLAPGSVHQWCCSDVILPGICCQTASVRWILNILIYIRSGAYIIRYTLLFFSNDVELRNFRVTEF